MGQYLFKLYVTGKAERAARALSLARVVCERNLAGQYQLEMVDVLEHPQLAEEEKILATPTLVRKLPLPMRRVIGDLGNTEQVIVGLGIEPSNTSAGAAFAA